MLSFVISLVLVSDLPDAQAIEIPANQVFDYAKETSSDEWENIFTPSKPLDHLELPEIHLGENAKLKIPSFKSIRIKKLISKPGARILIAKSNSGADGDSGVHGADASEALFFIDSVDGDVVIESRGGDGGDGRDGRHGQQGVPGQKGRDAFRFLWFYFGDGERGQSGGPGEDGEDGEDGGNGGNGAKVQIFYRDKAENSHIFLDVSAGQGGKAGRAGHGGIGGPGGPGGRGGKPGPQGHMGASGKDGRPGRPGVPGIPGEVSLFQVSGDIYRCLLNYHFFEIEREEWNRCISLSKS